MKKLLFTLTCFAMFTAVSFAQKDVAPKVEKAAMVKGTDIAGPQMLFEKETIDYGVIEQGSEPYRVFNFTNAGTEALVIKYAKGSCGCTVPEWPKEPILPGETNQIKVKYDTNRMGRFKKQVKLTTNISENPIVLTIQGEVKKKAAEPAGIPQREDNPFNNNKGN